MASLQTRHEDDKTWIVFINGIISNPDINNGKDSICGI